MTQHASIVFDDDRAADGTLTGTLTVGHVRARISGWRKGGEGLVLFDAEPETDRWLEDFLEGKLAEARQS